MAEKRRKFTAEFRQGVVRIVTETGKPVPCYNTRRLHSVCGFKSPIDYGNEYWAGLTMGLVA